MTRQSEEQQRHDLRELRKHLEDATWTPELVCEDCGKVCGPLDWHCEGASLRIRNLPAYDHAARQTQAWGLWRYAAMLPVRRRVSLGAGGTPLVPVQLAEHSFFAKLEYCNPTGSFKDRGTELMINHFSGA